MKMYFASFHSIVFWKKVQERSAGQDHETYEKLIESNARYLGRMVVDENKEVGSQENDKEIVDKQTKRENEQNLKAERQEENAITPTEKPEITVTPIIQNTEEQKAKMQINRQSQKKI